MYSDSIYFKDFYYQVIKNFVNFANFYPKATDICVKKISYCIDEDEINNICKEC